MRVWQLATGRELHTLTGHTGSAVAVADGRIVSGSADRTVRVWQLATGRELACWEADAAIPACDAALDETDGQRLIVAAGDGGGAVHVLELVS